MPQGGSIYTINAEFPFWIENDTYKLLEVNLYDKAGNYTSFYQMYADTFYTATSIPMVDLLVSGATLDSTGPQLTATAPYFGQASYDKNENIEFYFYATDDVSGVDWLCLDMTNGTSWFYGCGNLDVMGGNLYRMNFSLPDSMTSGVYYPEDIDLQDKAGIMVNYWTSGPAMVYSPDPGGWMPPTFYLNP